MSWKRFTLLETAEILMQNVPINVTEGSLTVNNVSIGSNNTVPYTTGALTVNENNIETPEILAGGTLNIISDSGDINLNPDGYTYVNRPNFNGYELKNIANASQSTSAVTKSYVDGLLNVPLKVQTVISNGQMLTLNTVPVSLLTAVSGKIFNIQSVRFFTYSSIAGTGSLQFFNGTTPMNWTAPVTVVTCSSGNNVSYVRPSSYTTVPNTDFIVSATSALTGSGTTYVTIVYTLSDYNATYD